jgi:hypothetical protein
VAQHPLHMGADGMSLRYDALNIVIMTRVGLCSGPVGRCSMISEGVCGHDIVNGR